MSKIINGQTDIELSGWWEANIIVSPSYELTQEKYEEHFDKDMVSYDMAESLLENGEELGECLPASCLNGYCREEIKRAMLENGDDYGVSNDFNDVPDWEFNYLDLTLDGEEADWSNLDDVSKEHIVNCVLEDNCKQGEVYMTESLSYSIDTDAISVEDGVFEGTITINGAECEFTYNEDQNNLEIESGYTVYGEYDNIPIPVEDIPYRCEDIVSAIKEACENIERELPSLDEKLDAAESKASNVSDIQEEKAKDTFDR